MRFLIVSMLALLGALPAFAQAKKEAATPVTAAPQQIEKMFPTETSWVVASLNGRRIGGSGADRLSLMLDQQYRLRGFGGCNTFSATAYPLRKQSLAVGPFAVTKKTCSGSLMSDERSLLVALRSAQTWDLVNNQLVIRGTAGELRLERAL
jgi:heat shock protein HslJ